MKIGVKKNKHVEVYQRNTDGNFEIAKRIALKIPNVTETVYEMFLDLSISEGITCGDCYGFQCGNCWRGIIVAYAIQNKPFFEWLHRHSNHTGAEQILKGISQINNR